MAGPVRSDPGGSNPGGSNPGGSNPGGSNPGGSNPGGGNPGGGNPGGGNRRALLKSLGPGLITGAADDDPSGIATYAQLGAGFGYTLGWTMVFSFPLMAVVQELSARIGLVTGQGIARNLRRHYPRPVLIAAVVLLVGANFFNLGADLAAMGEAARLVLGGPALAYAAGFAALSAGLEIVLSYQRYVRILKWLTLSLLAYAGVVMVVEVPWREAIAGALVPRLTLDHDAAMAFVAVLGTTISPYLFFWQAGEEVEELRRRHRQRLVAQPREAAQEFRRVRIDTLFGMAFSNLIALFIIIATAATLHAGGVTRIESAAEAAEALRPIAGNFAFAVFALGIIGTGLLAVPVLAGSTAYALAEMFGWPEGLDRRPREAKAFYATIAVSILGSVAIGAVALDPIRALYWSAVLNGLLAAPLIVLLILMSANRRIMGRLAAPILMLALGVVAALVMTAAAAAFILL